MIVLVIGLPLFLLIKSDGFYKSYFGVYCLDVFIRSFISKNYLVFGNDSCQAVVSMFEEESRFLNRWFQALILAELFHFVDPQVVYVNGHERMCFIYSFENNEKCRPTPALTESVHVGQ